MTYDLTTLKALKARIDAATEGDRELDADIAILFGKLIILIDKNAPDNTKWIVIFRDADYGCCFETGYYGSTKLSKEQLYKEAHDDAQGYEHLEHITSSIDAALALIEKVLPEVNRFELVHDMWGNTKISKARLIAAGEYCKDGASLSNGALALLSALFAALISKEKTNDSHP